MIRFLFDFIVAVLDDAADSTGFPALDAGELAMILRRSISLSPMSINFSARQRTTKPIALKSVAAATDRIINRHGSVECDR